MTCQEACLTRMLTRQPVHPRYCCRQIPLYVAKSGNLMDYCTVVSIEKRGSGSLDNPPTQLDLSLPVACCCRRVMEAPSRAAAPTRS